MASFAGRESSAAELLLEGEGDDDGGPASALGVVVSVLDSVPVDED